MAILEEQVLGLNEAAAVLPRFRGKRPAISTLWRWCRKGLQGNDGSRVRLEYARIGRRIVTSKEALTRFSAHLAQQDEEEAPTGHRARTPEGSSTSQRQKRIAEAEAALAEEGVH